MYSKLFVLTLVLGLSLAGVVKRQAETASTAAEMTAALTTEAVTTVAAVETTAAAQQTTAEEVTTAAQVTTAAAEATTITVPATQAPIGRVLSSHRK